MHRFRSKIPLRLRLCDTTSVWQAMVFTNVHFVEGTCLYSNSKSSRYGGWLWVATCSRLTGSRLTCSPAHSQPLSPHRSHALLRQTPRASHAPPCGERAVRLCLGLLVCAAHGKSSGEWLGVFFLKVTWLTQIFAIGRGASHFPLKACPAKLILSLTLARGSTYNPKSLYKIKNKKYKKKYKK